jgi:hypothetical protein
MPWFRWWDTTDPPILDGRARWNTYIDPITENPTFEMPPFMHSQHPDEKNWEELKAGPYAFS